MKQFLSFITYFLYVLFSIQSHATELGEAYTASYKITEQQGFQINTSLMRFTFSDDHIIRELPQQNIIEHWVRRDNSRHVFYRHFPTHNSSIYYNRGDLRALNLANDWQTVSQVIPHRWLDSLEKESSEDSEHGVISYYKGVIGDYQVSVGWLEAKQLPVKYTIRQQHQRLTMELTELDGYTKSLENLKEWDRYRKVDFSDAMDMERDGFVQYLIATGQLETSETSLHTH
ncbi:hypothetical protein [Vibrio agarivorans]|uniref:hypothetical protein n=1 Tax=Vibrio agarivorans TaxID=153622 RepID=UPI00222F723C|nr:hypothetical protein [Vibrio agarivorans]